MYISIAVITPDYLFDIILCIRTYVATYTYVYNYYVLFM